MIVSTLIIAVSLALFVYWFRYTCVLILNTRTTRDYSEQVAAANALQFVDVQGRLDNSTPEEMVGLQQSLERDYRLVNSLMQKAGEIRVGGDSLEETMLRIDFRIMNVWCSLSRRFSEPGARTALSEMSEIVAHLANTFGERETGSAQA